ncbi:hypothetical protein QBC42DRAFT_46258 [Cladorrhinum samala]|uniref:NADP-dependent oxidoreductase domain-containing protein n=1 Tax=Cladorrhinum samala TaxID=585594 RepID=A0AAV9HWH5_9PEZI|nr:hypothetical protein QBC42DRAFT_46258 [Cladorrhinum samala]
MAAPKVIFGAFQFNQKATHDQKRMLEICEEHGVRELDCGAIYQDCEPLLGSLDVANRFIVHGKAAPARNSEHDLLENATKSAKDLGLQSAGKKVPMFPQK